MHLFKFPILVLTFVYVFVATDSLSQGMGKMDNPAYKAYFDSLRQMDYNYKLPIFGKGAYKRGYDIPYAWGVGAVYFTQTQEIAIDQVAIGFNGSELVDISNIIQFGPTIATTNAYTVRPRANAFKDLKLFL